MTAPNAGPTIVRDRRRGVVLAVVLILIFALITAVFTFQRRAVIDATIAQNRVDAAEAEALARGGLRVAEAIVYLLRLKENAENASAGGEAAPSLGGALAGGGDLWERLGEVPIELEGGRRLRLTLEDEGARLNLNALVPQAVPDANDEGEADDDASLEDDDEALLYLEDVLRYVIDGMKEADRGGPYDEKAIAANLIDWLDPDETAQDGRDENAYYRDQDPPYRAANGPFLSFDEVGLVEGIDPPLLEAMRAYMTVHPIGGLSGINLNRAEPWVLSIVYAGSAGDRELLREPLVRDVWQLRQSDKILCDDGQADPLRCVSPNEVGNGDLGAGSFYPPVTLPAEVRVFRAVAEARVGLVTRRLEAVIDTRPDDGPQLLSWRRLRGGE